MAQTTRRRAIAVSAGCNTIISSLPQSFGARGRPRGDPLPPKWIGRYGALLPLFRRRPLHRRLAESEKPTASPQRSPETATSVCQGCADPCYCKISLRFSSNSALSISPWRAAPSKYPGRVTPSGVPQAPRRAALSDNRRSTWRSPPFAFGK